MSSISKFALPMYRISPYTTYSDSFNRALPSAPQNTSVCAFDSYFDIFVDSGRAALEIALSSVHFELNDEVLILTSSNSDYVSSCVTNVVNKFCRWSRQKTPNTRCVIVIHEFGKLCTFSKEDYSGCIIIEDYAHSFWGLLNQRLFSGDFIVFSLSKFLNIRTGGLLLYKVDNLILPNICENNNAKNVFHHYKYTLKEIFSKKNNVMLYYKQLLEIDKFPGLFDYEEFECPGAYVFSIDRSIEQLQEIKDKMQEMNIECSVFYGERAFFLPCNPNMDINDVGYIVNHFKNFLGELQ